MTHWSGSSHGWTRPRFEEGFRDWVQDSFALTDGQVVPIDGPECARLPRPRPRSGAPALGERVGAGQPPGAGPDARG